MLITVMLWPCSIPAFLRALRTVCSSHAYVSKPDAKVESRLTRVTSVFQLPSLGFQRRTVLNASIRRQFELALLVHIVGYKETETE